MKLIKGCAAHRAAAMVPEGHRHLVGGVILIGKSQELVESLGVAHIGGVLLLDELKPLAVVEPPLKFFRIHLVVLPHGGAAGLDDHIDVFGELYLHHFGKVGGSEASVGDRKSTRLNSSHT